MQPISVALSRRECLWLEHLLYDTFDRAPLKYVHPGLGQPLEISEVEIAALIGAVTTAREAADRSRLDAGAGI